MMKPYRTLSALWALAVLLSGSCSHKEEAPAMQWHVSVEAGATKALSIVGDQLSTYWVSTDKVAVVSSTDIVGTLDVAPNAMDNTQAALSGNVWGIYDVGDDFELYYPTVARTYVGQKGTLADLSANFTFLKASTSVTAVSGRDLTMAPAYFTHCAAYCHFTFTNASNGDAPITGIKTVQVASQNNHTTRLVSVDGTVTEGEIQVNPNAPYPSEVYFAIHDAQAGVEKYRIYVTDSADYIFRGYFEQNIEDGHFYECTLSLSQYYP